MFYLNWVLHMLQCAWEVDRGGTRGPCARSGGGPRVGAWNARSGGVRCASPSAGNEMRRGRPDAEVRVLPQPFQEKRRTNPFYLHAGATHTEWAQSMNKTRCKWFDHLIIHRTDLYRWCVSSFNNTGYRKMKKVDSVASIVWTVRDYDAVEINEFIPFDDYSVVIFLISGWSRL